MKKKICFRYILKQAAYYLLLAVAAIALTIVLKMAVFANYVVPTASMEPAIMAGDKIIVNKLVLGGRIVWNFFTLYKGEDPRISRLPGWRDVRRNDVLIFNYPATDWNTLGFDISVNYAKRCVAVPGDTFYITDGRYRVAGSDEPLGCVAKQIQLAQTPDSLLANVLRSFPYDDRYPWTIKNFGPLYIPGAGDRLAIDTLNVALYRKLLTYETGKEVGVRNGRVCLGDSAIAAYTFTKNYYFMTGDHVADSRDSRYWGLLPEEHIVGKVSYIWHNHNRATGKTSWKRFFKEVE
jgi:signal peptidase I